MDFYYWYLHPFTPPNFDQELLKNNEVAAVILEPVVGNSGFIPPTKEFLVGLRELTTKYGALLVFDEVMTGFRIAYGGAQEHFGVTPDVTTMGALGQSSERGGKNQVHLLGTWIDCWPISLRFFRWTGGID